jgi:Tol biopolymer transport system component
LFDYVRQLWVINADGSGKRQLFPTSISDRSLPLSPLSWSPDGGLIAFYGWDVRTRGIFVIGRNGRGLRFVAGTSAPGRAPTWLGKRIVYVNLGLYSVESDGSSATAILANAPLLPPVASPDGKWLCGETASDPETLYVVGADGGKLRTIGDNIVTTGCSWAPDSAEFAFVAGPAFGRANIWIYDVEAQRLRKLASTGDAHYSGGISDVDWH